MILLMEFYPQVWCLIIYSTGCLIPGSTTGALLYISNSADRNHGYDKEDSDEPHSLLHDELRHRTTFPAMHRVGCQLGTPGEKVCADYEHLVFSVRLFRVMKKRSYDYIGSDCILYQSDLLRGFEVRTKCE